MITKEQLQKYTEYAQGMGCNAEVQYWITHNLKNYLLYNSENQTEIEHILDYFSDTKPQRLKSMSYQEAVGNAEKWTKALQKKGAHIEESPDDTRLIHQFDDGFKIVELVGKKAFDREGYIMRHCSNSYFEKIVRDTSKALYSLRDAENMPHCTFEVVKEE